MSFAAFMFRHSAGKSDKVRNAATVFPTGIVCKENIRYGSDEKQHLLNVYYPEGTSEKRPTIVSIHGGGYVYGDKEVYHYYCADLARRGFTVVNFTYRLAPKHKFPTPLEDTNRVMNWIVTCAKKYHMDPQCIFLVGDSAGGQLASQYAAIATNPDYASLFHFAVPDICIRAVGLNCGMYDIPAMIGKKVQGIARDYLGRNPDPADPRYDMLSAITEKYPPAHVLTAVNDFLRDNARPMADFLASKGIPTEYRCYGNPQLMDMGHVFHVDIRLPEAQTANDDQCAFFRRFV